MELLFGLICFGFPLLGLYELVHHGCLVVLFGFVGLCIVGGFYLPGCRQRVSGVRLQHTVGPGECPDLGPGPGGGSRMFVPGPVWGSRMIGGLRRELGDPGWGGSLLQASRMGMVLLLASALGRGLGKVLLASALGRGLP